MALTQTQLAEAVAERAGLSKAQAKSAITALEEVVLSEVGNAEKVKIGNLVQLTVRVKPATKERVGRNPATGEEMTIGPKPASAARNGSAVPPSIQIRSRSNAPRRAAVNTSFRT